jgi:hypothetical protein
LCIAFDAYTASSLSAAGAQLKRLTIFAKGNLDVRDTLHALRLNGDIVWNGVNDALRERGAGVTARVQHQTWTRSDALLAATGSVPEALAARPLDLGSHPAAVQFSTALFDTQADVIVLSIQPDLYFPLLRSRQDGFLIFPDDWTGWPAADQDWLRANFVLEPLLDAERSMRNLEQIIARIRERSRAPILIYNVSSVVPGESLHLYDAGEEALSTRIRRFNLALVGLAQRTGISVVDVDRIVAERGAQQCKLDATHLTPEGCRAVAQEVVRILEDHGLLTQAGQA